MKTMYIMRYLALAVVLALSVTAHGADNKKPNILTIWGDDIGYWNVSAYNQGKQT